MMEKMSAIDRANLYMIKTELLQYLNCHHNLNGEIKPSIKEMEELILGIMSILSNTVKDLPTITSIGKFGENHSFRLGIFRMINTSVIPFIHDEIIEFMQFIATIIIKYYQK